MPEPTDGGSNAGASARREYERRKAAREARTRERYPRIGGLLLALQTAPQHETRWAVGAGGEELVAESLAKRCPDIPILHDRRIPGSRANIDHIAVAPSGVWVIDPKRYTGKVAIARPLFGKPRLTVKGRDRTKLVDGLAGQVALVAAAVAEFGIEVPVRGCLCFVESDLPLLRTLSINGFPVVERRRLAKLLNADGDLSSADVAALAALLATRFPEA